MKRFNQIIALLALLLFPGLFMNHAYSQNDSTVVELPYNKSTYLKQLTSPAIVITGEELSRYPTNNLVEALTGLIPGMMILKTNYEPGGSTPEGGSDLTFMIRGFSYTTIVDGVVRPLENLSPEEVESISVLRGMTARAMFGYPADNGLIVVKTKRGQSDQNVISANVEKGVRAVDQSRLPVWLNAYDYATMFNKAAINDGVSPDNLPYSQEQLDGYRTGINPLRYFDEDLYSHIFNNTMDFNRVNVNYGGGSETTNYFFNLNYLGEGGDYLKHNSINYDRIRLRSNVDVQVTPEFKYSLDVLASLEMRQHPIDMGAVWPVLATYPVNAYPVVIAPDTFGTHPTFTRNPVADLIKRDNRNRYDRFGQVNAGLEYDLGNFVKGLSADAYMSYDVYSFIDIAHKRNFSYAMYEPIWVATPAGQDSLTLRKYGEDQPDAGATRVDDRFTTRVGGFAGLRYQNTFGKHDISSNLNGYVQSIIRRNNPIDDRRLSYSLSGSYSYDRKYYLDVVFSLTGHQNLNPDKQFKVFPSVGLGWIISEEDFLPNESFINFLKLRASLGTMGFYNSSNPFLYVTKWRTYGNTQFERLPGGQQRQLRQRVYVDHDGNPDLGWGTTYEFTTGIDAAILNNRVTLQFDYFYLKRSGILMPAVVPDLMGLTDFYSNIGENEHFGVDGFVSYNQRLGSFHYNIGLNGGFNTSQVLADNLPPYEYDWLNRVGNPTDAIYGFEAIGLFRSEEDILNSPQQTYGAVLPGNIKYADLNGDDIISSNYDQKMIGHSNPRFTYGLHFSAGYKNFGIYVMGYGMSRRDVNVQSNRYFHQFGYNKYSQYIMDNAWTAENSDPNALHPRLTTSSVRNDNLNSTYYLRNASFFKIKNVELSYSFPENVTQRLKLSDLRLFARGANLFTIAEIKDLDPENLNLGINTYPSMRTFTGGVSVNF